MVHVLVPRSVEADIQAIGDYIALDDVLAAIRVMQRLYDRCHSLAHFPMRGVPYRDAYRRVFEGRYQIIYRVEDTDEDTMVYIVAIHHMSRKEPDW